MMIDTGDKSFDAWLTRVNQQVKFLTGLTLDDIPDCEYWDWYEDGVAPSTAANRALKLAMMG